MSITAAVFNGVVTDAVGDGINHSESRVNGLGMWAAWERNFSNKLKASLDLVDNAVDAAMWDSDDEDDDDDDSSEKPSLTREEKWKKHAGNIQITTERHRLAAADAVAALRSKGKGGGANSSASNNSTDDDVDEPPSVFVHDIFGAHNTKNKNNNNNSDINEDTADSKTAVKSRGNDDGASNKNDDVGDEYDCILDDDNTLCLHNNCVKPVKKLKKILDVYNSDKIDSAIGENGVGVKQAAAAMSDLSIVVTTRIDHEPMAKTNSNDDVDDDKSNIRNCLVSIGILSKDLQTKKACEIPSWEFQVSFRIDEHPSTTNSTESEKDRQDCRSELVRNIARITLDYSSSMGKAMKKFGLASSSNRRTHGINRLARHIELMISPKYHSKPPHPHQFLMMLHRFGKNQFERKRSSNGNSMNDADVSIKANQQLDDLLRDLADELPKTYLHIPPTPYFSIKVNSETIKFQHWERQLVELHKIPLIIDRNNDFRFAEDWTVPAQEDSTYILNVSIGFDPMRANPLRGTRQVPTMENTFIGGQACSLLIYSRVSGRLFLKHDDARGVLRLNNSGTHFCQGLTIIVDDYEGRLPLTPTKESLAFGLEEHGKIHERNLYAWLGAIANLYWTHFYTKHKTKGSLGEAIKSKVDDVIQLRREEGTTLPTLKDSTFSTVENVAFHRNLVQNLIRPIKSPGQPIWIEGPDTLIKLVQNPRPKPKKKKPKSATTHVMDGYDSDGNDLFTGQPAPFLDDDNAEEQSNHEVTANERLDGRPSRSKREPKRYLDIPEPEKKRTRKMKNRHGRVNSATNNNLEDFQSELAGTKRELAGTKRELEASKATCDDYQMLLEEREQTGIMEREKIRELSRKEDSYKTALQKVREENAKTVEELQARIRQLEGRKLTAGNMDHSNAQVTTTTTENASTKGGINDAEATTPTETRTSFVL